MPSENIVVTGFGPFKEHKINASWEAVKELKSSNELSNLIILEVPVEYSHVDTLIPLLWKKFDPKLVVHVGVSSFANSITLETCAYRNGYENIDCKGNGSINGECANNNYPNILYTGLNVTELYDTVNKHEKLKAHISKIAGRYLCEYIYYKSLSIDSERTLFVHVPPLNKPYNAKELATGLQLIIQKSLEQLTFKENEVSQAL